MQTAHLFHLQRMDDIGIRVDGAMAASILKLGSISLFKRAIIQIHILNQAVRAAFKAGQFGAAGMYIAEVQVMDALHLCPFGIIYFIRLFKCVFNPEIIRIVCLITQKQFN